MRRNAGRLALPDYLAGLSALLAREVRGSELLDLETTDLLVSSIHEPFAAVSRDLYREPIPGLWLTRNVEDAKREIRGYWQSLRPGQELWMAKGGSEVCGALRVTPSDLIEAGLELVPDGEPAVYVADPDGGFGIVLDADSMGGHEATEWVAYRVDVAPLRRT